ncbi:RNA polymerase sigma factor [Alicyclobacillus mengziensis]|uniref:RNA polymerase sigma factor n=1 Tax=Alicyclobacillus mengziensis TaxID=2931921 RepID=A0A9X7W1X4_9BACL|nr:RNA polymerase sigma factor [Alicyclobacillus mengziensis]QSO48750.1 RNA polymerase sigma factor [Alicyclobacillus mengziensis]
MDSEPSMQQEIESLYEMYAHDVYRFARYTLGDSMVASDVVQEVFLRAIRSWQKFRNDANRKTWLLAIARNYMYDYLRQKKKWEMSEEHPEPFVRDPTFSVDNTLALEDSLMALKKTYRQVFVLRHIEDLSVSQTAKILGWSESKVRTTDYRAVRKLQHDLAPDFQGGEIVK